jgi:hypothetical protein
MNHFIWPSDLARANNEELNRVCEQLEEVEAREQQLLDHVQQLLLAIDDLRQIKSATHTRKETCEKLQRHIWGEVNAKYLAAKEALNG